MALTELRQALQLTQKELVQAMDVRQAAVSKMEHRTEMFISTLRGFLHAMGGELEITAKFPEGDVKITQFENLQVDVSEAHA